MTKRQSAKTAPAELVLEQARALLDYNPETGVFTWKQTVGKGLRGSVAGTISWQGYRRITVRGVIFAAHRLAWLMVHGNWPEHTINHINGRKDDNRIANLEDIPHGENIQEAFRTGLKNTAHLTRYWAERRCTPESNTDG